jgi:hypothetical protein
MKIQNMTQVSEELIIDTYIVLKRVDQSLQYVLSLRTQSFHFQ